MYKYNTTKPPIILKKYGRHIQQITQKIHNNPKDEKQKETIQQLIKLMHNVTKTNQSQPIQEQLQSDYFTISNHDPKNAAPSQPLPPPKQITQQKKPSIEFKCCGTHTIQLIRATFQKIDNQENKKEIILTLLKIVAQFHKKSDLKYLVNHIEKIAKNKIPLPYEQIEKAYRPQIHQRSRYNYRKNK